MNATRTLLILGLLLTAVSAQAEGNYNTLQIEYKNHSGAYLAKVQAVWETAEEDRYFGEPTSLIGSQENKTVNFSKVSARNDSSIKPQPGDEIWLRVDIVALKTIEAGKTKTKSCRKDNTRFYYASDGGKLTVKTAGTFANDNRCKLVELPDDSYLQ